MFRKWLSRVRPSPTAETIHAAALHPPLGQSGHVDTFARDNLPPRGQWPELTLDRPEFTYPEYLNVGVELTDQMVERGFGDRTALIGNGRRRTYKELTDWTNRLAHVLVETYGVVPGNRVLILSGNNPAMVAAWLAATKAGAVIVNVMPNSRRSSTRRRSRWRWSMLD
jgi:2-aminobenzoate-CoA ligase